MAMVYNLDTPPTVPLKNEATVADCDTNICAYSLPKNLSTMRYQNEPGTTCIHPYMYVIYNLSMIPYMFKGATSALYSTDGTGR